MNSFIVFSVLSLKLFLPLLILKFPFQASWLNFILDTSDGDILMHFGLRFGLYQSVDKVADYWTYIMMLLVGRKWKIATAIIALFLLRTAGQGLFFLSGDERILFFFPNFLEPLFMVYSLLLFRYKNRAYKLYKKHFILIWLLIGSYKMWNEWNTHIANIELSEMFFGFNN